MAADATQAPKDLIGFLDFYLVKKAPFQIPDNAREWIVKYGPWITVVLLALSLPLVLFVLGVGATFMPFGGYGYAAFYWYATVFFLVHVALMVAALPGLFARKMSGWTLMFYAQLVSFVFSLLSGSVLTGLISLVISLYILFQIRSLYTA